MLTQDHTRLHSCPIKAKRIKAEQAELARIKASPPVAPAPLSEEMRKDTLRKLSVSNKRIRRNDISKSEIAELYNLLSQRTH